MKPTTHCVLWNVVNGMAQTAPIQVQAQTQVHVEMEMCLNVRVRQNGDVCTVASSGSSANVAVVFLFTPRFEFSMQIDAIQWFLDRC